MPRQPGHGWWPYLTPIFSFLALVEIAGRFSTAWTPFFAAAKVLVPLALLLYFARGGAYPELRGRQGSATDYALDVLVGVLGAALWVAPYLWIAAARPGPDVAFDPQQLGASREWLALSLRALGFAVVTPFAEELFVRSWLARYADVFDGSGDFRDVPIARYSFRSFATVLIFFTVSHQPWEWPVAVAWIVLTQLWFYRRGKLLPMVLVHAASNLSIFLFVLLANGRITNADGSPLSLWFFL
ncbi:MAG TPA: CPBP family glutamic-type intramembrane protease [Myxococcota bacterium]